MIMDGFLSYGEAPGLVMKMGGVRSFPAERWPHTVLGADAALVAQRWAAVSDIPVVVGLTTPSLVECGDQGETECVLRATADRYLTMHRPEVYCGTAKLKPEYKNVACLTGTRPQWWDTRCSRLRFRPADLKFETVV